VFHRGRRSFFRRLARFWLLNMVLLPVQLGLLALSVEQVGLPPVAANVVVLGVVFALRYLVTAGWVFRWRAGTLDVVEAATPQGRRRFGPIATARFRFSLRLCVPPVAMLLAFPALPVAAVSAFTGPALPVITLLAVMLAAVAIVALRSSPPPDDPAVHDRQVDAILAVPPAALSLWLTFGWSEPFGLNQPVTDRMVVAATAFLAASCLVLLGTRLTARLRWAMLAPLLGLPLLTGAGAVGLIASWGFVVGSATAYARRPPGGANTGPVSRVPVRRIDDVHEQFLPPAGPALSIVGSAAALLCASVLLVQWGALQ
jgi:hypothetical protein